MVMVPLVALAWFPLYRAAGALAGLVPRPRVAVTLGALRRRCRRRRGGCARLRRLAHHRLRPGRVARAVRAACVVTRVLADARGRPLTAARPARASVPRWPLPCCARSCLGATWIGFGDEPRSLALVGEESMGAKVLLQRAAPPRRSRPRRLRRRASAAATATTTTRASTPAPRSIRGNGIDEDCDGADAPRRSRRRRPVEADASAGAPPRFKLEGQPARHHHRHAARRSRSTRRLMPHLAALAKERGHASPTPTRRRPTRRAASRRSSPRASRRRCAGCG